MEPIRLGAGHRLFYMWGDPACWFRENLFGPHFYDYRGILKYASLNLFYMSEDATEIKGLF